MRSSRLFNLRQLTTTSPQKTRPRTRHRPRIPSTFAHCAPIKMFSSTSSRPKDPATALLKSNLAPFTSITDDFRHVVSRQLDTFGNAKVLLIGDASHGTSEFYAARAEITKYMIQHHDFNIVAVEADWPDAEAVDRYVRWRAPRPDPVQEDDRPGREPAFVRFPTWMWRNQEVKDFVEWLREYNRDFDMRDAVGFYGLDLYSLGTSMEAVIEYLDQVDPEAAEVARDRYGQLMDWAHDPQEYGFEAAHGGLKGYEKAVVDMLRDLLRKRLEYLTRRDGIEFHSAEQNARLVVDAEHYYKAMYHARDESWNLRDTHMFQTLNRVLKHRGAGAKTIVWAHNSHIGDARATDMGWSRGELNIGQLCKETFRDQALAVGCGTYYGKVAAAHRWGGDMNVIKIRPGLPNSVEELMHSTGVKNFVLDLREGICDPKLREALMKHRLERFIGVIYKPDTERQSHYSQVVLPRQFDAFVWFDETNPVGTHMIHQPDTEAAVDGTWPFGL